MVRRTIGYGASMLIAMALLAGAAAANPLALVTGEGGGQAAGQVDGGYHVDASGALDAADETQSELHDKATQDARNTNRQATETKHSAWAAAKQIEAPQRPACECDAIGDELEQVGEARLQHADSVEKAANLDTEYVDAGADVGATGSAKAWFSDLFQGASDAFDEARSLLGYQPAADDDVKQIGDQVIGADDELRDEVVNQLDQEHELPKPNPRLDGSFAAEHASSATSSAVGQATTQIP